MSMLKARTKQNIIRNSGLPQVFDSIKKEYDIKRYAYYIKTFEPIKTRLHRVHITTLLVI